MFHNDRQWYRLLLVALPLLASFSDRGDWASLGLLNSAVADDDEPPPPPVDDDEPEDDEDDDDNDE